MRPGRYWKSPFYLRQLLILMMKEWRVRTALEGFTDKVLKVDYYGRLISDMKFHYTLAALAQSHIQLRILEELFDLLFLRYSHNLVITSISEN